MPPARAGPSAFSSRSGADGALDPEQQPLALEPAAIAADTPARVQDPMAGDDDRDRVRAERVARGAIPTRAPGPPGDLLVARDASVGDPLRSAQDPPPKALAESPVEREVELVPPPREVLVELATGGVDPSR